MAVFAWVTMGLAFWHFAIFVPDRFWGGIVGSFLFALVGGVISGFVLSGLTIPGNDALSIQLAFEALPGTLLALALCYWLGARRGNVALEL